MNRLPFVGKKRLYRHARIASRWRRRSVKGSRDQTRVFTRSNPGGGFMARVVEAAKEFKRKHGGQAYGWAADQASMAPRGEKQRFWAEVASLLRREVYATNPKRGRKSRRVKFDRWEGTHNFHGRRIERARRKASRHGRGRRNPKRDGTATRGEKRKDKYKDYLRSLREKGEKASAELNKLLGRGVHKPHGEVVLKAPTTATQAEHPGHYAAELSSDQKFAQESISQLEATMADIRTQMRDLGDDDEALADELSDRLINLGDQKRALLARVKGTPVATNPRRGRNPRYTSPARYRRMSTDQRARYRRALRLLRATVHHFRY